MILLSHRTFILFILSLFWLPNISALAVSETRERGACSVSLGGTTITGLSEHKACRYSIRYGDVKSRWSKSTLITSLKSQSFSTLPPSCPQHASTVVTGLTQSEDCLFAIVYVPQGSAPSGGWPVFVWIHGGSFVQGSASAAGLDGSQLAYNGGMIVVVLQYRLGILGFLPPLQSPSSADPNLGLQDVILGLQAVQIGAPSFGGDRRRITVGGQSSGAQIIRAMWGMPTAQGLFRAAILQSDPMIYGFSTPSMTAQLQSLLYSSSQCSSCSTLVCLQSLSLDKILSAQDNLILSSPYMITGVPLPEPIRPTTNTSTLPMDPTFQLWNNPSSLSIQPSTLPILITTVKNEAGQLVQSLFPSPVLLSNDTYLSYMSVLVGQDRASKIYSSGYYPLPSIPFSANGQGKPYGTDGDNFREAFDKVVTDAAWRCSNRDGARRWAAAGGKVWVGEWRQGVTYPDNAITGGYCEGSGKVCHEDDIYLTFNDAPNPEGNTTTFEASILARWAFFIAHLDPNTKLNPRCSPPTSVWKPYTPSSAEIDVFPLGGDGLVDSCPPPTYWGESVQYDWQLYG